MDDFKKYVFNILKAHTCDDDLDDKVRCLGLGRAESFEIFTFTIDKFWMSATERLAGYAVFQHFVNKPG